LNPVGGTSLYFNWTKAEFPKFKNGGSTPLSDSMAIIIRKSETKDEYHLYSRSWYGMYMNGKIHDFWMEFKSGLFNDFSILQPEVVYENLDIHKDFKIIKRLKQQLQDNGLVYDTITYSLRNNKKS
jgi:hypothetical protein